MLMEEPSQLNIGGREIETSVCPNWRPTSRHIAWLYCAVANASAVAARRATSTIPIVFTTGGDPVELGLVDSLNRPGGNVTGITMFLNELSAKRLEMLRELVPNISRVAFMVNPTNPRTPVNARQLQAAARIAGLEIVVVNASHESDFSAAFETLIQDRADALLVEGDVLFNDRRDRLVELAARHRVPASYPSRESAIVGGLTSYGPSIQRSSSGGPAPADGAP
jgi:putative ABC transport system substrate-binding protein